MVEGVQQNFRPGESGTPVVHLKERERQKLQALFHL